MKTPDPADPAAHATLEDKRIAFEWLRSVAISESENAHHAAILMYELGRVLQNNPFEYLPDE